MPMRFKHAHGSVQIHSFVKMIDNLQIRHQLTPRLRFVAEAKAD